MGIIIILIIKMKASLATMALVSNVAAVNVKSTPDVYGPNGNNYTNLSAD